MAPEIHVQRVVLGQQIYTLTAPRATLLARLNRGQLLVNYIGHDSVDVWAGECLRTADDV